MATPEEIQAKIDEIKAGLEAKGFVFGTFEPDYQALFTEVYGAQLAGITEAGSLPGENIIWDNVDPADIMAVISGEIKKTDLYVDLSNTIDEIPDLRLVVDNVMSNISPDWSNLEIYGPGQIVSYGGFLWENVEAILVPTNDFPSQSNTDWKQVGAYNNIYNTVDGISIQIYNAQTAADSAASQTSFLQAELLGDTWTEGDPAEAGSIIYENQEAIVGEGGAIAVSEEQMRTDFLGVSGDATSAGYLYDIILDSSVEGSLANTVSILQVSVGDNTGSIAVEQGLRAITMGPDYRNDTQYPSNAVTVHGGLLYQNKTGSPIGPEEWTVGNWTAIDQSLYGQYNVKIDINGKVAGFGLANDGATSNFIVNADSFAIADQAGGASDITPFIVEDNQVWMDTAYIRNLAAENFVGNTITANSISLATEVVNSLDYATVGDIAQHADTMEEDFLLLATEAGEIVNQLPGITNGITNFNSRNDRLSAPVDDPVILSDGSAIDFTFNADGSANIDFAWTFGSGTAETNIDGFIIYLKADITNTVYDFDSSISESHFFQVPFDKREIRLFSLTVDKYYTVGVEAYRVVDADVDPSSIIRSTIVQPSLVAENPVYLDLQVPAPSSITITEL
jgi:hypothetical protein